MLFSLSPSDFSCINLGVNIVTLTVTDESGNSDFRTAEVTVIDIIEPSASAIRSLTYDLADGSPFNLTANDIDNGPTDNCDFVLSIDETSFTLPGIYTITLTATDAYGNSSTDTTEVEITDSNISTAGLSFGKLKLTVFPVPFNEVINISFSEPTDLNTVLVQLLDFNQNPTGVEFTPNGVNLVSDDTSGLNIGNIYWLVVTITGKKTQTQAIDIIKK